MKTNRNDPCPCGSGKKYKLMVLLALGILPVNFGIVDSLGNELLEMNERLRAPKAVK